VKHRPNLTLLTDCVVDKITIEDRKATGVEIVRASRRQRLTARQEVIVSAGSIASPTLLLRSGIGSGAELKRHGIDVVRDLPGVGRNLQDHLITSVQHKTDSRVPYGISVDKLPWVAWQVIQYALFRKGMLTNPMLHVGGFVRTEPALDRPDIQFLLLPAYRSPGGTAGLGHGYGLSIMVLRPKSRGMVTIRNADPSAPPAIDPHFLEEAEDMELLLRGVKFGRRVLAAPAWNAVRGPETHPGPDIQSDEALREYIRSSCSTAFHPVGTCKMGKDDLAVVDPQLRVHGISGLRVADASIMPTLIGGNTAAPAVMIGEKASDMILGKKPLPPSVGV
jgi:choline dehydrogenase